ncbi:hypothetical protein H4R18_004486 [Coemansia javaensis]|uniref:YABBY protein C-terminal domain-containing protein n=1 Tax=Coemansia javaensis TaxID=2761396 RepID=A0A9W8H991_9FUNG|nr:hypothetical protein H4R18_004486 [Coemansia javaensis]
MEAGLRNAFLDYCGGGGQQALVQQLTALRAELARYHSAHECAKEQPEVGPLLATLARSRAVASSSEATRAVIDAALEYSKAACAGPYANQRAALWFSRVVQSLLAAAGPPRGRARGLPDCVAFADEAGARRAEVQRLVRQRAAGQQPEPAWDRVFAACCGPDRAALLEHLAPALDERAWAQLAQHRLAADHGLLLLARLPPECATMQVLHLLAEPDAASADVGRVVRAVLADAALARQMADDVARLVLRTGDWRVAEMWMRLCRGPHVALRLATERGEDLAELFGGGDDDDDDDDGVPAAQTRLWRQWRCVAAARALDPPAAALRTWLGAVAAAGGGYAFRLLDRHFGAGPGARLAERRVVLREAALEVAAFAWAPLGAGGAARDGVVRCWHEARAGDGGGIGTRAKGAGWPIGQIGCAASTKAAKPKATKAKVAKASTGKKMTPYNKYMKTEIAKVKQENPGLNHKEAFKMVALRWKTAPENPKAIAA